MSSKTDFSWLWGVIVLIAIATHAGGGELTSSPLVIDRYAVFRPAVEGSALDGEFFDGPVYSKKADVTLKFLERAAKLIPDYAVAIDVTKPIPSNRLMEVVDTLYKCGVRRIVIEKFVMSLERESGNP